jgi:hypothetical protein
MKDFHEFISENALGGAPEGAPKPERKIGKVKIWIGLDEKKDGYEPWDEVEYTRRVKSDTVPNAHWYFIGASPITGMSRGKRSYRSALVYLIDTDGILLGEVGWEDISIGRNSYGRWRTGSSTTGTFAQAKQIAERLALRRIEKEKK